MEDELKIVPAEEVKEEKKIAYMCPSCKHIVFMGDTLPGFLPLPIVACPACGMCFIPRPHLEQIMVDLETRKNIITPANNPNIFNNNGKPFIKRH